MKENEFKCIKCNEVHKRKDWKLARKWPNKEVNSYVCKNCYSTIVGNFRHTVKMKQNIEKLIKAKRINKDYITSYRIQVEGILVGEVSNKKRLYFLGKFGDVWKCYKPGDLLT